MPFDSCEWLPAIPSRLLFSMPSLTNAHLYIWNCGSLCAGRASAKSKSLHTDRYKPNHAGLLCAAKPFAPALTTQLESSVDIRFRCVLVIINTTKSAYILDLKAGHRFRGGDTLFLYVVIKKCPLN